MVVLQVSKFKWNALYFAVRTLLVTKEHHFFRATGGQIFHTNHTLSDHASSSAVCKCK